MIHKGVSFGYIINCKKKAQRLGCAFFNIPFLERNGNEAI